MEIKTEFHRIGEGAPPYVIAEIGLNHNGDGDLARRMIAAAASAGASCAKFQWFHADLFYAAEAALGDAGPGSLRAFFRSFEFPAATWQTIAEECRKHRIDFACSVFDHEALRLYQQFAPAWVKIASGDVDNVLLIKAAEVPVILSTGTADDSEVQRAVAWLREGALPFAILQCVSLYPAAPEHYNLRVIPDWVQRFDCPVGISDHCMGNAISLAAVALGACVIERHFTLDRTLPGPDQAMSIEPAELAALVQDARSVQLAQGDGRKRRMGEEAAVKRGARRGLHAARDLAAGEVLTAESFLALRPEGPVGAARAAEWLGRKLKHPIGKGQPFTGSEV